MNRDLSYLMLNKVQLAADRLCIGRETPSMRGRRVLIILGGLASLLKLAFVVLNNGGKLTWMQNMLLGG